MSESISKAEIQSIVGGLSFRTQAFIDGVFVDAASGQTFETINPATGSVIANVAAGDAADIDAAVVSARMAVDSGVWSSISPSERKQVMFRFADLIDQHTEELATLESLEAGKPITDCLTIDVPETSAVIRWHAEAGDKLYDAVSPTNDDVHSYITKEPIGICGCVLPWNFPLMMAGWKLGPALITGNSVILKPAELTSLSTLRLAELAYEAGIPKGVLNVVPGLGEQAGQALGLHDDVDLVAFTGSTDVGRLFLEYSARSNMKRIVLECGGKNPQIVMADAANLDTVAEKVIEAAFWNMGENCSAGSRLIVHSDIKDKLLAKVVEQLEGWQTGDPLDPEVALGALIEKDHMDRVLSFVEAAKAEGGNVVIGGAQLKSESAGYFVAPTIVDGISNDATVAQQEIFGPVLAVITFETEQEAIDIANDTCYGLAASLWTESLNVAHRVSRAIKAGTITVNTYGEGDHSTPFGGYKLSGFGGRDKSVYAHDQYCELKTTWIQLTND